MTNAGRVVYIPPRSPSKVSTKDERKDMQALTREAPMQIRRCGYNDTGFAFYLVRTRDRKTLERYVKGNKVTMPPGMKGPTLPYGFYFYKIVDVIPGLLDESHDGLLFEVHIIVSAEVSADEELRHWRHEIGHACGAVKRCALAGYSREAEVDIEELPAYANEFLLASVDAFLTDDPSPVCSGFPLAFPWLCEGGVE